jgi:hypothetical protein
MWYLYLVGYMIIGFLILWLTVSKLDYEYENVLAPIFIVLGWPFMLVIIAIVTIFGLRAAKDMDAEEKKREEFRHP